MNRSTFSKKVNELCELQSLVAELSNALKPLKARQAQLTDEIVEELGKPESQCFFAKIDKNLSSGFVGDKFFTLAFSKKVARKGGKDETDQGWLIDLQSSVSSFVVGKLALAKDTIKSKLRAGDVTVERLKELGLVLEPTASLSVCNEKDASEVKRLVKKATEIAAEFND